MFQAGRSRPASGRGIPARPENRQTGQPGKQPIAFIVYNSSDAKTLLKYMVSSVLRGHRKRPKISRQSFPGNR